MLLILLPVLFIGFAVLFIVLYHVGKIDLDKLGYKTAWLLLCFNSEILILVMGVLIGTTIYNNYMLAKYDVVDQEIIETYGTDCYSEVLEQDARSLNTFIMESKQNINNPFLGIFYSENATNLVPLEYPLYTINDNN